MPPRSTVTRMRAAPENAVMAGFPQNAFESAPDSCETGWNACCDRLVCYDQPWLLRFTIRLGESLLQAIREARIGAACCGRERGSSGSGSPLSNRTDIWLTKRWTRFPWAAAQDRNP